MWKCSKCGELLEEQFDSCWKCETPRTGESKIEVLPTPNPMHCPRCTVILEYVGTKRFHEGTRWDLLFVLGELFVNREHFDLYVCPRCGRVEFFIDGIGEEFRPH
jgi:phage FluMu protein Com